MLQVQQFSGQESTGRRNDCCFGSARVATASAVAAVKLKRETCKWKWQLVRRKTFAVAVAAGALAKEICFRAKQERVREERGKRKKRANWNGIEIGIGIEMGLNRIEARKNSLFSAPGLESLRLLLLLWLFCCLRRRDETRVSRCERFSHSVSNFVSPALLSVRLWQASERGRGRQSHDAITATDADSAEVAVDERFSLPPA